MPRTMSSTTLVLLVVMCFALAACITTQATPVQFLLHNHLQAEPFAVMVNDETTVRFSSSHNITYPSGSSRCASDAVYHPDSGEVLADERCYIDFVIQNYHISEQLPFVRAVDCVLYDMSTYNFDAAKLTKAEIYAKTTSAFRFSTPAEETVTPAQYDAEKNAIIYRHFLKPELFYEGHRGHLNNAQFFQLHCQVQFDAAGRRPSNQDSATWEETFYHKSPAMISLNGLSLTNTTFAWTKSANAADNTRYLTTNNVGATEEVTTTTAEAAVNVDETFAAFLPREADPNRHGSRYADMTYPLNTGSYALEKHLYTLYDWSLTAAVNYFRETLAKATTTQSPWAIPYNSLSSSIGSTLIYNGPGVFLTKESSNSPRGRCRVNGQLSGSTARGSAFSFSNVAPVKHLELHCPEFVPLYIPNHLNKASYAASGEVVPNDKFLTNPTMTMRILHHNYDSTAKNWRTSPTHALSIPLKFADQVNTAGTTPSVAYHNTFVNPVRGGVDTSNKLAPGNTTVVASFQLIARNFTEHDEFTLSFNALGVTTADLANKKVQVWVTPFSGFERYAFSKKAHKREDEWDEKVFFEPDATLYDTMSYKEVLTDVSMDGVTTGASNTPRTTTKVVTNNIKFNPWGMFIKHSKYPDITPSWVNDEYNVGFDITLVLSALTVDTTHDVLEVQMTALYQNAKYSAADNAKQVTHSGVLNIPLLGATRQVQKPQDKQLDTGVFRFSPTKGMRMYINNPEELKTYDLTIDLLGDVAWAKRDATKDLDIGYYRYQWSTSSTAEGTTDKYHNNGILLSGSPTESAYRHGLGFIPTKDGRNEGYLHLERIELDMYGAVPKSLPLVNRADPTATTRPSTPVVVTWRTRYEAPMEEQIPMVLFINPAHGEGQAVTTSHGHAVDTKFTKMSNKERKMVIIEDYDDGEGWLAIIAIIVIVAIIAILLLILLCVFKHCKICCWKHKRNENGQEMNNAYQSLYY